LSRNSSAGQVSGKRLRRSDMYIVKDRLMNLGAPAERHVVSRPWGYMSLLRSLPGSVATGMAINTAVLGGPWSEKIWMVLGAPDGAF
jgi:hypothetical protein